MKRWLITFVLMVIAAPAWGVTYHVNKSGDNANSCATAQTNGATAKVTISNALQCLSAGDTLEVHTGTYSEKIRFDEETIPSGTSASRITIRAAAGETVTIQSASGAAVLLELFGTGSYTTWKGFILDANNTAAGVVTIGGGVTGVWVEDNTIKNATCNGVLVANNNAGTSNVEIRRNLIHNNGLASQGGTCGGGYGVYSGTQGLLVEYNEIYNNGQYGVHIYSEEGNTVTSVVRYNKIHDNQVDAQAAGIIFAVGSNIATRNIIYNERSAAIEIGGFGGMAFAYNNTIHNSGTQGLGSSIYAHSLGSSVIKNNAISSGSGGINVSGANVTNNNTSVNTATCYTNAAGGDFTLIAGCALINAGTASIGTLPPSLNSTSVTVPFNGTLPDIGAHESLGAVSCVVENATPTLMDCTVQNNVHPPILPAASITGWTVTGKTISSNTRSGTNGFQITVTVAFTAGTCALSYAQTGNLTDSALIGNASNQELFAGSATCTNNVSGGAGATITQSHVAMFTWDGSEGSGPQIGSTNAATLRAMVHGKYLARLALKTTVADTPATNYALRYSKNGGAYAVVPTFTGTEDVGICDAPGVSASNTTQRITSGSFEAGRVVEVGAGVPTITMTNGESTELLYPICYGPNLVAGTDNIKFRIYKDDGTALAYDNTLNVDVVSPGLSGL
jgi:hypothetical protein